MYKDQKAFTLFFVANGIGIGIGHWLFDWLLAGYELILKRRLTQKERLCNSDGRIKSKSNYCAPCSD